MWYFTWVLGVSLACALGVINALWFECMACCEVDEQE